MYNLIENETKTLMLANARSEYAFTLVDPAVTPEVRIRPRRTLMVLIGLLVGGLLGMVIAFAHGSFARYKGDASRGS
jgi:LPS O-antigen subunit length determinant protein (WzzB/FepE family)